MLNTFKNGQTSVILRVKLLSLASATGAGLTGLTNSSSGLTINTIANNESSSTVYAQGSSNIEDITTLGTYAAPTSGKCRFKEVSASNHPGIYEIQLADARFAVSNATALVVSILNATNLQQADFVVQLQSDDPNVAKPANFASFALTAGGATTLNNVQGIKKNVARKFYFVLFDSAGAPKSGVTVTAQRALDGATSFSSAGGTVAEVANGSYCFSAAQADLNADDVLFRFSGSGAVDGFIALNTQQA